KAISIIRDSPAMNPELFELLFTGKAIQSANVEVLFNVQITDFDKAGKIKSRDSYDSAKNSILDFADGRQCSQCHKWFNPSRMQSACTHKLSKERQKSGVLLNNIDKDFLVRYHAWMRTQGNSV